MKCILSRFWAGMFLLASAVCAPALADGDAVMAAASRREGAVYQQQGDLGKALFYYERADTLSPGDPATANDIAVVREAQGDLPAAEAAYRLALQRDKGYLPAYLNLGLLLARAGRAEEAAGYLRERVARGRGDDAWTLKAQEALDALVQGTPALRGARARELSADLAASVARQKEKDRREDKRRGMVDYTVAMAEGVRAYDGKDYEQAVEAFTRAQGLNPGSGAVRHALLRAVAARDRAARSGTPETPPSP